MIVIYVHRLILPVSTKGERKRENDGCERWWVGRGWYKSVEEVVGKWWESGGKVVGKKVVGK